MLALRRLSTLVLLLFAFKCAQSQAPNQSLHRARIFVRIILDKTEFKGGDPITYKLVLSNESNKGIYVSKSFGEAGGGYAGFHTEVKQLSGRKPKQHCVRAGDVWKQDNGRTPEQILKEDFFIVWPGQFIGYNEKYDSCEEPIYPGTYEITADYSAQDWYMDRVKAVKDDNTEVLTGSIDAKPVRFHVIAKSKK